MEKAREISLWPGIVCLCEVMLNGSIVFNSDPLAISLRTNQSPGILKFTNLPTKFYLSGRAWNFGSNPKVCQERPLAVGGIYCFQASPTRKLRLLLVYFSAPCKFHLYSKWNSITLIMHTCPAMDLKLDLTVK